MPGAAASPTSPRPPRDRREIVSRMLFCFADSQRPAFYTVQRIYATVGARCFPTESSWIVNIPIPFAQATQNVFDRDLKPVYNAREYNFQYPIGTERYALDHIFFADLCVKCKFKNSRRLHSENPFLPSAPDQTE